MLHRNLNKYSQPFSLTIDHIGIKGNICLIEISYELLYASLIMEGTIMLLFPVILKVYLYTPGKEGGLTKPGLYGLIIKNCLFKYLSIRLEGDSGTMLLRITGAYLLKRVHDLAALIPLLIYLSVFPYLYLKPLGKSIDH